MPDIQIVVKTKTELDGLKKTSTELKALGKEITSTGTETAKLTTQKSRLLDGLKNLGREIPGVGAALNFLKNPFTLLGFAAVAAAQAVRKVVEEVNELAAAEAALNSFNSITQTTLELQAKLKTESLAFKEQLANIGTEAKTGAAHLRELNEQLERNFEVEEKSGKADPTRERRKGIGAATALFNAGTRAGDLAAAAALELPGAEAELESASAALRIEQLRQGPAVALDSTKRSEAQKKLQAATKDLLGLEELSPQFGSDDPRSWFQQRRAHYQRQIDTALSDIEAVDTSGDQRQAILEQLQRPIGRARGNVNRLRAQLSTGTQEFQDFRGGAAQQFGQLNDLRPSQDPGQPGRLAHQQMLDRRVDALLASLKRFQEGVDAHTGARAKAASQNTR